MNILITGGAGFIGSHLCKHFLDQTDTKRSEVSVRPPSRTTKPGASEASTTNKVICIDNLSTGRKTNIKKFLNNKNFKFIQHDIVNPLKLGNPDIIYNLASPASPSHYQKDPISTWKTNIIGTLNMLELAKKTGATLIQASTSEIYGDPGIHPQKESYWGNVNPTGIRSCYDESKRAAETIIMDYVRKHKINAKIVRIFNTYGPNMDPLDGRVVSNFIMQALQNKPITIYGDGSQTRSFQYIDDLIKALALLPNTPKNFTGPINIGNPQEFTILELAKLISKLIPTTHAAKQSAPPSLRRGATASKASTISKIVYKPLPQDDPVKRCPDISLAHKILKWRPEISLEEGLKKTIPYFAKSLK